MSAGGRSGTGEWAMEAVPHAAVRRHRLSSFFCCVALLAIALFPALTRAADIHWTSADGNWNDPTQWTPAQVPAAADVALVDNAAPGSTAHVTTANPTVTRIEVRNGNVISL